MFLKLFISVCLFATFVVKAQRLDTNLDSDEFEFIALAVTRVEFNQKAPQFYAEEQACYAEIGCFNTSGPMQHVGELPDAPDKISTKFIVFTHSSPNVSHEVYLNNTTNFTAAAQDKIAIIIHGFNNDAKNAELVSLKDSILLHSKISTVIMIDWAKGAAAPWYETAAVNTQLVGREVALLINKLKASKGVNPDNVHLFGFSLGAHVAGFAGKWSQSEYKWSFGRISALDSASPLFQKYPGSFLTSADAKFVDAIHTSAGTNIVDIAVGDVGFKEPFAHIDFFPNGGSHQPQCALTLHISCNHYSSVVYMDTSLKAATECDFKAFKCVTWDEFNNGTCADTKGDSKMGYYSVDSTGRGSHFLKTNKNYPYCQQ